MNVGIPTTGGSGDTASAPIRRRKLPRLALVAVVLSTVCVALTASISAAQDNEPSSSAALACDDELATAMSSNADAQVLLVKEFQQGERLLLTGEPNATTPIAGVDLCLVKLLVGPGNPGPAEAPSTSAGIGIEILLPSHDGWNERIRAYGNSGWAGSPQASLSLIASDDLHAAAAARGFVVATSDHGHVGSPIDASFAMNPDGSINTVGWQDFSERSLHELAEKTKLLTRLYYGRAHEYAYWDGFSTGGRQGLKLAQVFPNDFDGILVGAPAINWSRYHTAGLYAQIAMEQDLGYLIAPDKLATATQAAISACGGAELGFLIDPLSCRYDPTLDAAVLCEGSPGNSGVVGSSNSQACLTSSEAAVINKAWYGQTTDGSAPAPATDNGNANILSDDNRLWFGWTRGTDLTTSSVGGAPGIILAADQTALELQDPALGSKGPDVAADSAADQGAVEQQSPGLVLGGFTNATGNGENRWLDTLGYAGLADAQAQGVLLQPEFSAINTDDPDLTEFAAAGGKLVMYHGLADEYIPVQGSINYYERVMAQMDGPEAVQQFYRFYLIPGFTHSGRSEGRPSVPVPQPSSGRDEMFMALQNWVEGGEAPEIIEVESGDSSVSLPLCAYPLEITYDGNGSVRSAASYSCK